MANSGEHFVLDSVEFIGREIMDGKVMVVQYYEAQCAAFAIRNRFDAEQLKGDFEDHVKQQYCRNTNLSHPNVLKFLGLCHSDSIKQLLVTEMVHETVTSLVESQPNVPLHVKLSILLGVSSGLWYLHSRDPPVVHGRLSCNSIFLTDQLEVKIAVLGVDDVVGGSTPKSKAQEALQETLTEYSTGVPIDVFCYGGVILHVVNQELPKPFYDNNAHHKSNLIFELSHQGYLSTISGLEIPLLPLVEACLSDDPTTRPTMESVYTKMEAICAPYTGIDITLWRLDQENDPTITASKKRISDVLQMASDIHRAHQRGIEQDQVISSLRVWSSIIYLALTAYNLHR